MCQVYKSYKKKININCYNHTQIEAKQLHKFTNKISFYDK